MVDDPRYPIGRFEAPTAYTPELRAQYLTEIEELPANLRAAVAILSDEQLDTPYREGGWTVRQVVHHVADSHLNAYLRAKLAISVESFTAQPYPEHIWASFEDAANAPVELSLTLLEGMHGRWVRWFRSLADASWSTTYFHPEDGVVDLNRVLAIYSWHGRHHVAHIMELRKRMGW